MDLTELADLLLFAAPEATDPKEFSIFNVPLEDAAKVNPKLSDLDRVRGCPGAAGADDRRAQLDDVDRRRPSRVAVAKHARGQRVEGGLTPPPEAWRREREAKFLRTKRRGQGGELPDTLHLGLDTVGPIVEFGVAKVVKDDKDRSRSTARRSRKAGRALAR